MKYDLRFSKVAVQDIDEVLEHTLVEFGERQLENYRALIQVALEAIETDPMGPPATKHPSLRSDVRMHPIARQGKPARHYFVYRVEGTVVIISRLLHDAMDLRLHLPPEFGRG